MSESNVEKVLVYNSELQREFNLYVRMDRVQAFCKLLLDQRSAGHCVSTMPGLTWAATLGLDAIFDRRPKKFPVNDILAWLVSLFDIFHLDSPVTKDEVESALERFSAVYPPDVGEDA